MMKFAQKYLLVACLILLPLQAFPQEGDYAAAVKAALGKHEASYLAFDPEAQKTVTSSSTTPKDDFADTIDMAAAVAVPALDLLGISASDMLGMRNSRRTYSYSSTVKTGPDMSHFKGALSVVFNPAYSDEERAAAKTFLETHLGGYNSFYNNFLNLQFWVFDYHATMDLELKSEQVLFSGANFRHWFFGGTTLQDISEFIVRTTFGNSTEPIEQQDKRDRQPHGKHTFMSLMEYGSVDPFSRAWSKQSRILPKAALQMLHLLYFRAGSENPHYDLGLWELSTWWTQLNPWLQKMEVMSELGRRIFLHHYVALSEHLLNFWYQNDTELKAKERRSLEKLAKNLIQAAPKVYQATQTENYSGLTLKRPRFSPKLSDHSEIVAHPALLLLAWASTTPRLKRVGIKTFRKFAQTEDISSLVGLNPETIVASYTKRPMILDLEYAGTPADMRKGSESISETFANADYTMKERMIGAMLADDVLVLMSQNADSPSPELLDLGACVADMWRFPAFQHAFNQRIDKENSLGLPLFMHWLSKHLADNHPQKYVFIAHAAKHNFPDDFVYTTAFTPLTPDNTPESLAYSFTVKPSDLPGKTISKQGQRYLETRLRIRGIR